ncbi:Seven transmembrane MLO family protein, putative isoform 1 [Hibiscus syriacus]|uniref:Seven transmembrane MLO family protein, putative isoform 1 n=1 Tax=Hibiscus syriacus TaxID=106335 RepID=A0A6A2Y2P7_HIBSY|nr:uncharacterized protein LOC120180881 isoform X2 [Hibiscus syriacus]KAE8666229.1 Seven transmembrane MLO family protein, putative isoform 1 [Hibiscus syriacus]
MADNFSCIIGAMDRLWFHQTVLYTEPFSLFSHKTLKPQQPYSESPGGTTPISSRSESSLAEENFSASICPIPDHEQLTPSEEEEGEEEKVEKRARRGSVSSRSRSQSSSPSSQKNQRNHRHSTSCAIGGKLWKSTSCKSLKELELEEVKGFMDLGFIFKKEHLDLRMINVVPGLLRLGFFETDSNLAADGIGKQEENGVMRPYLSEAWLIKRPDSPLLNLKLPRVSAAADMKKHLKCWAQTVAYVVQQEC